MGTLCECHRYCSQLNLYSVPIQDTENELLLLRRMPKKLCLLELSIINHLQILYWCISNFIVHSKNTSYEYKPLFIKDINHHSGQAMPYGVPRMIVK